MLDVVVGVELSIRNFNNVDERFDIPRASFLIGDIVVLGPTLKFLPESSTILLSFCTPSSLPSQI